MLATLLAGALLVGCGGSGDTPTANGSDRPIASEKLRGKLTSVEPSEVAIGDELVVNGTDWLVGPAVTHYLLKEEGFRDYKFMQIEEEGFEIGSEAASADGAISFRFELQASYESASGQSFAIAPGATFYVAAVQRADSNGHAAGRGPIIVVGRGDE